MYSLSDHNADAERLEQVRPCRATESRRWSPANELDEDPRRSGLEQASGGQDSGGIVHHKLAKIQSEKGLYARISAKYLTCCPSEEELPSPLMS